MGGGARTSRPRGAAPLSPRARAAHGPSRPLPLPSSRPSHWHWLRMGAPLWAPVAAITCASPPARPRRAPQAAAGAASPLSNPTSPHSGLPTPPTALSPSPAARKPGIAGKIAAFSSGIAPISSGGAEAEVEEEVSHTIPEVLHQLEAACRVRLTSPTDSRPSLRLAGRSKTRERRQHCIAGWQLQEGTRCPRHAAAAGAARSRRACCD
jgi:hypothetical protein